MGRLFSPFEVRQASSNTHPQFPLAHPTVLGHSPVLKFYLGQRMDGLKGVTLDSRRAKGLQERRGGGGGGGGGGGECLISMLIDHLVAFFMHWARS